MTPSPVPFVAINEPIVDRERWTLPLRAGDALDVTIRRGALMGYDVGALDVGLYRGSNETAVASGRLTELAPALYTEITLRLPLNLPSLPGNDPLQCALVRPNGQTVGGTFQTKATTTAELMRALVAHYESYPHAPVLALPIDEYSLTLRFYEAARFNYRGNEVWTLGLGRRDPAALNTNRPKLVFKRAAAVLPAVDTYTLVLTGTLVAGNLISCGDKTVSVSTGDTALTVLGKFGLTGTAVPGGASAPVQVGAGASLNLAVKPGSQTVVNTDAAGMTLNYVATEGGQVRYRVAISGDVRPGNVYSVTGNGLTTQTITAGVNDTAATIRAFFGGDGGFLVPAGSVPMVSTYPGTQTIPNSSGPDLYVTGKKSVAQVNVDRYTIWVDTDVVAGNEYRLRWMRSGQWNERTYAAKAGDDVVAVAKGLGFGGVPFTLDADAATAVTIWAKPGSRIREATHKLPLTVTAPVRARPTYVRLSLQVPTDAKIGEYTLLLTDRKTGKAVAWAIPRFNVGGHRLSALVHYRFQHKTSGWLWGRLRLPLTLSAPKPRVTESQFMTLDQQPRRSRVYLDRQCRFLTDPMPAAFHPLLAAVLKSSWLSIDETAVQHFGEYSTDEQQGPRKLMQGSGEMRLARAAGPGDAVELVNMGGVLAFLLNAAGDRLPLLSRYTPVPTGEYWLLLLTDEIDRHIIVRQAGFLQSGRLSAGGLVRLGPLRIGPAEAPLRIEAQAAPGGVTTWQNTTDLPRYEPTTVSTELVVRGPDFTTDFNADYQ